MSDTPQSDPMLDHLRERKAELVSTIHDAGQRLVEIDALLAMFLDGRTRVRRRLRDAAPGNGTAEQPQEAG
jgi:hypothetical protein